MSEREPQQRPQKLTPEQISFVLETIYKRMAPDDRDPRVVIDDGFGNSLFDTPGV